MPLVTGSALAWWAWQHHHFLETMHPASWLALFCIMAVPNALSLIPNTLVGLLAGHFLGMKGLGGMVVSFMLASVLGYFMGRILDAGLKESVFAVWPAARKTSEKLQRKSVFVVALFRLSPAPPFAVGSLMLSWFRVPLASFLWGGLLGMLPRMAVVVWVGSQAVNMVQLLRHPGQSTEIQWITALGVLVVLGGILWLRKLAK